MNMRAIIPIVISLTIFSVPLGVSGRLWTISPVSGWILFVALLAAWVWVAWAWTNDGISWLKSRGKEIQKTTSLGLKVLASIAVLAFGRFSFDLAPLLPENCAPDWEWRPIVQFAKDKTTDRPALVHFIELIPKSSKKYEMEIVASGKNLKGLSVQWREGNKIKYSRPFDQPETAIGAVATYPTGRARVILLGRFGLPDASAFNNLEVGDPTFRCLNDASHRR